jgi:hypothetical protein
VHQLRHFTGLVGMIIEWKIVVSGKHPERCACQQQCQRKRRHHQKPSPMSVLGITALRRNRAGAKEKPVPLCNRRRTADQSYEIRQACQKSLSSWSAFNSKRRRTKQVFGLVAVEVGNGLQA